MTNAFGEHVTRFPASDPSKAQKFKTGYSGSGLGIDSQGNVWVTNRLGNSMRGAFVMGDMILAFKTGGNFDEVLTRHMFKQQGGHEGGSVTLLRPDGSEYPGSPFTGGGLPGPWAATIDGNDNVWISNFAGAHSPIVELCGARTENCPPGFKSGDQISPPGGYVGGGLQMQTDLAIDPAGNVWVMNNWQDIDSCFGVPDEVLSTAMRWPGRHHFLRNGEAGTRSANWAGTPGTSVVAHIQQGINDEVRPVVLHAVELGAVRLDAVEHAVDDPGDALLELLDPARRKCRQ